MKTGSQTDETPYRTCHAWCWFLWAVILVNLVERAGTVQVSYTAAEQQAYVKYYRRLHGPLQNLTNDVLFQVAKGAELAVTEYNDRFHTSHELRYIKDAVFSKPGVLSLHLYIQTTNDGLCEGHFEIKTAMFNSSIISVLLRADVTVKSNHCDKLSSEAGCTKCSAFGRCLKGHVPANQWLDFALHTQQEIQINEEFPLVQMPAAHNAFNNRGDGYGVLDDCRWPPPYDAECIDLANQEFSLTDMLNMGVRSMEIDPWWCFDAMRMSHAMDRALGCAPTDRLFKDGMKEIGDWVQRAENAGKVIRIYFEDGSGHTEGHDDLINGPIKEHLGEWVFTPTDIAALGRWPTLREMKQMKKTVLITSANTYTHGGIYIHEGYWTEHVRNEFTPYPGCGNDSSATVLRYYCDSTNYGPFWNGPNKTGVILDFAQFMECGIQYPAADQINPMLLETAVWTWARGQPSKPLDSTSCVYINGIDHRWYLSSSCTTLLHHACADSGNQTQWVLGAEAPYGQPQACPTTFQFSLPVNGYKQQQLISLIGDQSVWINISPFVPLLVN